MTYVPKVKYMGHWSTIDLFLKIVYCSYFTRKMRDSQCDFIYTHQKNKLRSSWRSCSWPNFQLLALQAFTSSYIQLSSDNHLLPEALVRDRLNTFQLQSLTIFHCFTLSDADACCWVSVFYWKSSSTFYGINGICFPLHVQRPDFVGWKYSAFIFLGVNVFS